METEDEDKEEEQNISEMNQKWNASLKEEESNPFKASKSTKYPFIYRI